MSECLFCGIVAGEIPSRQVYSDDDAIAFLDIAPLHRGHSVIVPRDHVLDGTASPADWAKVAPGIVAVSQAAKAKLGASGVNILSNAGAVSGQSVFHFHVHVIPRYDDNPGMEGLLKADRTAGDLDEVQRIMTA
ncbi:MAG: HIT domain-containing protein [Propionibacteriaceae bacterium]|jgi:histidine triad (HIT) family protein|nr:HIT domain-containing protein [Propionibacteriaceae bacterium]